MFPEGRILDFAIVAALALIVVGPKDLPMLMRRVGEFVARMRAMAAEFRASFDEIARQSELDALRREVEAMRAQVSFPGAVGALAGPEARSVVEDIQGGLAKAGADLQGAPTEPGESAKSSAAEASPAETSDGEQQPDLPFGEPSTEAARAVS